MKNYKNRKNTYLFLFIVSLIILVIGTTYAWFNYVVTGDNVTIKSGTLSITYLNGTKIDASNLKPATQSQVSDFYSACQYNSETSEKICAKYSFTIENTGTLRTVISVMVDDLRNTYTDGLIKYLLLAGDLRGKIIETTPNIFTNIFTGSNNMMLMPGATETYTLLVWLDESATITEKGKELSGTLKIVGEQTNYME